MSAFWMKEHMINETIMLCWCEWKNLGWNLGHDNFPHPHPNITAATPSKRGRRREIQKRGRESKKQEKT